jgi:hypothetical protein
MISIRTCLSTSHPYMHPMTSNQAYNYVFTSPLGKPFSPGSSSTLATCAPNPTDASPQVRSKSPVVPRNEKVSHTVITNELSKINEKVGCLEKENDQLKADAGVTKLELGKLKCW